MTVSYNVSMASTKAKSSPVSPSKPATAPKPAAKRKSRVFSVSFPEAMARQLELAAAAEQRSVSEYVRELFRQRRRARSEQFFQRFDDYKKTLPPTPYTPEDVEGLVDEVRAEMAVERARKR